MLFNIYIANHGKRGGVEDYITILQNIICKRGHQVQVSEELAPNVVNILIDEFTNAYNNSNIKNFKSIYPDTTIIFVLTEFFEKKWLVKSFNFFGNILDAATIAFLSVYIRLQRKDFNKPTLKEQIMALIYLPLFLIFLLIHCGKSLLRKKKKTLKTELHTLAYMLMRYMGLYSMLPYADGLILSHQCIRGIPSEKPVLGLIYPEIDYDEIKQTMFHDKQLGIEVTGSVTSYRRKVINKIDQIILINGLKHNFNKCQIISFSDLKNNKPRSAYSIHPPQSSQWKYSSPTRIYRALQYDHNMPILTKKFSQHPIENLCLELEGFTTLIDMIDYYKKPDRLFDLLEPKVKEYNSVSELENDKIIEAILTMSHKETV